MNRQESADWATLIGNAVAYLEEHLADEIDYAKAAQTAFSSVFHFRQVFGIVCGVTPAEYVRKRRLTLAGTDLAEKGEKVIDVALRYGYETPESFSRAFSHFHGISPSQAKRGAKLNSFPWLAPQGQEQKSAAPPRIEKRSALTLVGYKKRFTGAPFGEERARQEREFFTTTRAKQWLLLGASCDYQNDYCVVCNADDSGYDFYIACKLDEWTIKDLYDPHTTGVKFMDSLGFEKIEIPEQTYLVCETPAMKRPLACYTALRAALAPRLLPPCGYSLIPAPELTILHWRTAGDAEKERRIEICLPVKKN